MIDIVKQFVAEVARLPPATRAAVIYDVTDECMKLLPTALGEAMLAECAAARAEQGRHQP